MPTIREYSPEEEIARQVAWEKANAARFSKFLIRLTAYGAYYRNPADLSPGAIPFVQDTDKAAVFSTYSAAEDRAKELRTTYGIGTFHLIVVHDPAQDTPQEQ